jgi:hypothetical protein
MSSQLDASEHEIGRTDGAVDASLRTGDVVVVLVEVPDCGFGEFGRGEELVSGSVGEELVSGSVGEELAETFGLGRGGNELSDQLGVVIGTVPERRGKGLPSAKSEGSDNCL